MRDPKAAFPALADEEAENRRIHTARETCRPRDVFGEMTYLKELKARET